MATYQEVSLILALMPASGSGGYFPCLDLINIRGIQQNARVYPLMMREKCMATAPMPVVLSIHIKPQLNGMLQAMSQNWITLITFPNLKLWEETVTFMV